MMIPAVTQVWADRNTRTLRRFLLQVRHLPVPSAELLVVYWYFRLRLPKVLLHLWVIVAIRCY